MSGAPQLRLRTHDTRRRKERLQGDRMQDARPSNVTECGVRGNQAGLRQTESANNWANQQDSTM